MKNASLHYFKMMTAALCLAANTSVHAQTLIPKQHGSEWGYVDGDGKWVIDARYFKAYPFSTDSFSYEYAMVLTNPRKKSESRLYKILNKKGEVQLDECEIKGNFNIVTRFVNGTGYTQNNSAHDVIFDLKTGKYTVLPEGASILEYDGWATSKYLYVVNGSGHEKRYGLMLADNLKIVLDITYNDITCYTGKNYISIVKDGKYGLIDTNLNTLLEPRYNSMDFRSDGKTIQVSLDGKSQIIDFNGHVVSEMGYEAKMAEGGGTGLFAAKRMDKWGFVNKADQWVIEPIYADVHPFSSDGKAMVKLDNGQSTMINTKGEKIGKYMYDNFGYHYTKSTICIMQLNKLWGYIDMLDETIVIPAAYEIAEPFDDMGMAKVKTGGRWGFIDKTGKMVIPAIFAWASDFDKNGCSIVSNGDKKRGQGLINRLGKPAIAGHDQIFSYDLITRAIVGGDNIRDYKMPYDAWIDLKKYTINP